MATEQLDEHDKLIPVNQVTTNYVQNDTTNNVENVPVINEAVNPEVVSNKDKSEHNSISDDGNFKNLSEKTRKGFIIKVYSI